MRRRSRSIAPPLAPVLLASVLLVACDKKSADEAAPHNEAEAAKAEPARAEGPGPGQPQPAQPQPAQPQPAVRLLAVGTAKIMPKGQPDKAVELGSDGTLKFADKPDEVALITVDGKLSEADGTAIAEVGADGSVMIDGKHSGMTLTGSGLALAGPDGTIGTITFAQDGTVVLDPKPDNELALVSEGCSAELAPTCALILAMYMLTPREVVTK